MVTSNGMKFVYGGLIVLIFIGLVVAKNARAPHEPVISNSPIDAFAQCLGDAGAKFYGTFWCSHCKSQKELFKNSKTLPYVECSTPNGQSQTKVCADVGVTSYPTWILADGTRLEGEQTFETLAEKTNCTLPVAQP